MGEGSGAWDFVAKGRDISHVGSEKPSAKSAMLHTKHDTSSIHAFSDL